MRRIGERRGKAGEDKPRRYSPTARIRGKTEMRRAARTTPALQGDIRLSVKPTSPFARLVHRLQTYAMRQTSSPRSRRDSGTRGRHTVPRGERDIMRTYGAQRASATCEADNLTRTHVTSSKAKLERAA